MAAFVARRFWWLATTSIPPPGSFTVLLSLKISLLAASLAATSGWPDAVYSSTSAIRSREDIFCLLWLVVTVLFLGLNSPFRFAKRMKIVDVSTASSKNVMRLG